MNLFAVVAFVLFVIAAVFAFFTDADAVEVAGIIAAGLAAYVLSGLYAVKVG